MQENKVRTGFELLRFSLSKAVEHTLNGFVGFNIGIVSKFYKNETSKQMEEMVPSDANAFKS